MKIWTLLAFVLIAGLPHAAAHARDGSARSTPPEAVDEIKALELARNQALLHGDVAALDKMTSEDYTFVTLRGEMRSKSEILKGFASGTFKYESREIFDLNVRVYGDTAVVTGRSTQKGMENQRDYSGSYWFTRVYIKQEGHWVSVALQATLIQK